MKQIFMNRTPLKSGKTFDRLRSERIDFLGSRRTKDSALSFKEIFGDLSDCRIMDYIDEQAIFNISQLNLSSLEGCPSVVDIAIYIDMNPNLINLSFFPRKIIGLISVQDCKNLESLKGVENLDPANVCSFYLNNNRYQKPIQT